jgi:hypothetical protein
MNDKKRLSAWAKAVITVGSVSMFLLIAVLGVEAWARQRIRTAIEKEAITLVETPVTVRVGMVGVRLASQSLTIRDVVLKSRNIAPSGDSAALVSLDVQIADISLRGIGYRKVVGQPAVSARELLIDTPHITLVTKTVERHAPRARKKDFRQMVVEHFASVSVDRVEMRDAEVEYVTGIATDKSRRFRLTGAGLVADGLRIDTVASDDRILFCKEIDLNVTALNYGYADGAMVARVDTLSASSKGVISLSALRLVPRFAKDEYARKSGGHQDWTKVDVTELNVFGVDFRRMIAEKLVTADSITLGGADIASYKNKQVFRQPSIKPLVWQTLQNLPVPVDIRKIAFKDVSVEYDELSETGATPGIVGFSEGRGEALNVTNIAEGHDPYFTVNVSAMLMNNGQLSASCDFPVSSTNDHFRVRGKLGGTDMGSLNPVLTPLMNIRIDSGTIDSLAFELNGNHISSNIEFTMLYRDLSVSLLKAGDISRKREFLTFVADDILIKSANPRAGQKVRTVSGKYTRDPERSTFNYIWKSFVPAITKTVL